MDVVKRDVHLHSHPSRVEHWRHVAEIVAFAMAAVWALYVFVYQEQIKPESVKPDITLGITVAKQPIGQGLIYVKIGLQMKNNRESTASIAGIIVNTYGVHYTTKVANFLEHPANGATLETTSVVPDRERLIQAYTDNWRAFGSERLILIRGGDTFDESVGFAVRAKEFDIIKLRWWLCYSHPGDKKWDPGFKRDRDGAFAYSPPALKRANATGLICRVQLHGFPYGL